MDLLLLTFGELFLPSRDLNCMLWISLVLHALVRLNKNNFSFLFFFICLFLCFFVCLSNPTCPYKNPSISVLILLACSIISNISPLHQVAVHLPCVCVIHAFCNSKVFPFQLHSLPWSSWYLYFACPGNFSYVWI